MLVGVPPMHSIVGVSSGVVHRTGGPANTPPAKVSVPMTSRSVAARRLHLLFISLPPLGVAFLRGRNARTNAKPILSETPDGSLLRSRRTDGFFVNIGDVLGVAATARWGFSETSTESPERKSNQRTPFRTCNNQLLRPTRSPRPPLPL